MLHYLLFITLSFITYAEITIGNILFRHNSSGNKSMNIISMLSFMIHPLHNCFLWNVRVLDINYPFIIFVSSVIYILFLSDTSH
jgi:hypothetical protein